MDANLISQIANTLMSFGDQVWQEALVFLSGGGLLILFKNRTIISAFVIATIKKIKDTKSAETIEAKKAFGTELAHIMDGINVIMEQKAGDYQYQLDVATENLTPEQKAIIENGVNKAQAWIVKTADEVMPRLLNQLTEVMSDTFDKVEDKLND